MWWSIYICTYTLLWCACSLNRPSFHSLSFLSWTKNEQTLGAGFSYDASIKYIIYERRPWINKFVAHHPLAVHIWRTTVCRSISFAFPNKHHGDVRE
jgi:hypothetical protein